MNYLKILEANLELLVKTRDSLHKQKKPYNHISKNIEIMSLRVWIQERVEDGSEFLIPELHDTAFILKNNPEFTSWFIVSPGYRKRASMSMLKEILNHTFLSMGA